MTDYYPHVWKNFEKLLNSAMEGPKVIDLLWETKHGNPNDPHGLNACLRLDKMLGGSGTPASDYAVEFSHNAGVYLELLLATDKYPAHLKKKADRAFPPFGSIPKWECPHGFRVDWSLLKHIFGDKRVEVKFRSSSDSHTIIVVRKKAPMRWLYPWQQAISAHFALTKWHPATMQPMFPRVSSKYWMTGKNKVYLVVFQTGSLYYANAPLLITSKEEILFEMQTLDWDRDGNLFTDFLKGLR